MSFTLAAVGPAAFVKYGRAPPIVPSDKSRQSVMIDTAARANGPRAGPDAGQTAAMALRATMRWIGLPEEALTTASSSRIAAGRKAPSTSALSKEA